MLNNKQKMAFSLLEAMIILLLISVALMALIPLMSQKSTFPRWMPLKNGSGTIEAITYGNDSLQRVGIGSGVSPYMKTSATSASDSSGKLVTDTMALISSSASSNSGIFFGNTYLASSSPPYGTAPNGLFPANSVVLGMNACSNTPTNALILRSEEVNRTCVDNSIHIGSEISGYNSRGIHSVIVDEKPELRIRSAGDEKSAKVYGNPSVVIEVTNNEINFRLPDKTVIFTVKGAEWDSSDSSTFDKKDTVNFHGKIIPAKNATEATGTIYIGNTLSADTFNCTCIECNGEKYVNSSELASDLIYADMLSKPENNGSQLGDSCTDIKSKSCKCDCRDRTLDSNPNICPCVSKAYNISSNNEKLVFPFVRGNDDTYCKVTTNESVTASPSSSNPNYWQYSETTLSDRRLKNIIGKYNKGLSEISKVDTFLFTFKSDLKQRLHAGIIAQKIKGIFDEALSQDEKGFYSYEKSSLLYAMVNAVKEINQKQTDLLKKQTKLNKKADKLIRMYE